MPVRRSVGIALAALRKLAGDTAIERGERYARANRVHDVLVLDGWLTATIIGEQAYRTRLKVKTGSIADVCTCPIGDDGACCKHCVALGLHWLTLPKTARSELAARLAGHSDAVQRAAAQRRPETTQASIMLDVEAPTALPKEVAS